MLMTGSDERAVAGIERLTKQQFEVRTLAGVDRPRQRSDRERGERGERRRPAERRERTASPVAPRPPVDDFFTKPYEPTADNAEPSEQAKTQAPEPAASPRRPAGRVSALLGGKK